MTGATGNSKWRDRGSYPRRRRSTARRRHGYFHRGLCLPSDNKMKTGEKDRIIEVIKECFE